MAAQWRLEQRERHPPKQIPDLMRHTFQCDDADLLGVHDLIFDGAEPGELAVPCDASVRRAGDEIPADASVTDMSALCSRWLGEAQAWSRRPGAGAALIVAAKDGRLVWVGVYVSRGPKAEIGP